MSLLDGRNDKPFANMSGRHGFAGLASFLNISPVCRLETLFNTHTLPQLSVRLPHAICLSSHCAELLGELLPSPESGW